MAQKTKTTLMRAEREKIKMANAKKMRVAREKKERKMSGKDGDGDGKDEKEPGVDCKKAEEKQGRKTMKNKTGSEKGVEGFQGDQEVPDQY